ncbi:uncharacterized protein BDV14DRAFT_117642 [Aspergillus stella-maris]|uniref:uncharacterized protein n=1 Tax=Aspergillus stella-maris TaxID=1810926 RepID=UPI003CCE3DEF
MPPISRKLASEVAFILDEANIPNMVFGWIGLTLSGANFNIREIEFVIPDAFIDAATNVLVEAGYDFHCTHPDCPELQADRDKERNRTGGNSNSDPALQIDRYHTVGAAHFHIDNWAYLLTLYKKSEVLWWVYDEALNLSTDPLGLLAQGRHSDLILSNDVARIPPFSYNMSMTGSGPWHGLYPVRTLNPASFTEAVILLVCRNLGHIERVDRMWGAMLLALKDEEDERGDRYIVRKNVGTMFRRAWEWFNHRPMHGDKAGLTSLIEFRHELKRKGLLGPLPLPEVREVQNGRE